MAQVSGRQNLLFSQRLELDVWYVQHWSFWLDIKILSRTVANVFTARGVISGQDVAEVDDLGLTVDLVNKASRGEAPTARRGNT
jgi:hypothetical protein